MEFQFGTNWATYSRFGGDVFGSALAAQGIFTFFLESGFLAIVAFGREKVRAGLYLFSMYMVWPWVQSFPPYGLWSPTAGSRHRPDTTLSISSEQTPQQAAPAKNPAGDTGAEKQQLQNVGTTSLGDSSS